MDPLDRLIVRPGILIAIARIDEFKGRWAALGALAPERLTSLRRVATIQSVGSSTRIEGSKLSDDMVKRLLSGLEIRTFRSRDEQEVAGYAALMDLIFESWPEITLTENHIRQLHGVLLKHCAKDEHHRGRYKTLPNRVEAFDEEGRSVGTIFDTASPFDTPRIMTELVDWARDALEAGDHHPILVISVFIVRFLAIHPFQDGNGRLSRALTTLLLLRSGYGYVPYSSLERVVEGDKDAYYMALRQAQATLDGDESHLGDWVEFFVQCLVRQKETLERKLDEMSRMAPLPHLAQTILRIVEEHGRITVREGVALTGASRNTIKDHLRRLVQSGQLTRQGRGRGTWYEKRPVP